MEELAGPADRPSLEESTSLAASALRIALWLNATKSCKSCRREQECTWPMNSTDGAPRAHPYLAQSLYYGSPGTAIFLQQLATTRALPEADAWRGVASCALAAARSSVPSSLRDFGANAGFYYGLTGIAYGLRAAGDSSELFATAASTIEEHVLSRVAPFSSRGGATLWNNTDVAHGASGTGLYFLWMATRRPELREETRRAAGDAAVRAGTWLLSRAEPTARGLRWARGPRCSTAGP